MTDTLLVDGSDLSSANRILQVWDDPLNGPVLRGANITIPYVAGELRTDKYQAAQDFTAGLLIKGTSYATMHDELAALYALLPDLGGTPPVDASCVLTLRLTYGTGTVDTTANAEYLGALAARVPESERHARVALRFRLLDGWFA